MGKVKALTALIALTAVTLLTACSAAETKARESLEAEGITYAQEEWDQVFTAVCQSDRPELELGMQGALSKYQEHLTRDDYISAVTYGHAATIPNGGTFGNRKLELIFDTLTNEACPDRETISDKSLGVGFEDSEDSEDWGYLNYRASRTLKDAGISMSVTDTKRYSGALCEAIDNGLGAGDRAETIAESGGWSVPEAALIDFTIMDEVCFANVR